MFKLFKSREQIEAEKIFEKHRKIAEDLHKEKMMTREEAEAKLQEKKIIRDINGKYPILDILEVLGLIKFDEPIKKLFEQNKPNFGTIRIEEWPEGLVLWIGGEIKYKSWEKVLS